MNKDIYVNDLLHRYSGYSFVETVIGSMTQVEFQDGGSSTVAEATTLVLVDAYRNIRQQMLEGSQIPCFISTTAERDALTGVDNGTIILNDDSYAMECVDDDVWYPSAGTTTWNTRARTTVQTTDATATQIDTFDLDDDEVYMVQISVVGIENDATDRCGTIQSAVIYREGGGGATILGSIATMLSEFSDNGWAVDITVSGNAVRATVTGEAATTIDWNCSMQFIEQ